CTATGDEYCSGERTLSARVHQGWRSRAAEKLALVGLRRLAVDSGWPERQQGKLSRIPQRVHRAGILRDLQEDRRIPRGHDLLQRTAAGPQAPAIPRRFALGTVGPRLFPWGIQRCRRDRQGFQAVRADRRQMGILQLQSSRAESPDRPAEAKGGLRILPSSKRKEGRGLDAVLSPAGLIRPPAR